MRQTAVLITAQAVTVLLLLLVWQWAGATGRLPTAYFGTPHGAGSALADMVSDGSLLGHVGSTLAVLTVGFVVGTLLGVAIGALIGVSEWARDVLEPFILFFNGMPRIILQPFFVVWLGFGFAPKVGLVIAVIVVMVAVTTAAALKDVDRDIVANTRILGANRLYMVIQVYIPSLALMLIASARTNLGFALQATLVSEFVGTASGLGYLIVKGQLTHNVNIIWAALITVVVLSVLLDFFVTLLERRTIRWMP
jgi:NitT/TauT family transport system permease protein